jgi:hypothetical protein
MSTEDWKITAQLCKVLQVSVTIHPMPCILKLGQVFKNATMAFSKSESNIAKVLPAMDKIHDVLETNSANSNYSPAIKSALAAGTRLLSHYYTLADHSMVYRFATSKST